MVNFDALVVLQVNCSFLRLQLLAVCERLQRYQGTREEREEAVRETRPVDACALHGRSLSS